MDHTPRVLAHAKGISSKIRTGSVSYASPVGNKKLAEEQFSLIHSICSALVPLVTASLDRFSRSLFKSRVSQFQSKRYKRKKDHVHNASMK